MFSCAPLSSLFKTFMGETAPFIMSAYQMFISRLISLCVVYINVGSKKIFVEGSN